MDGVGNHCLLYPSVTDRYISLLFFREIEVTDLNTGHVFSLVYDKEEQRQVTIEDALALAEVTEQELYDALSTQYDPQLAEMHPDANVIIQNRVLDGFRMGNDGQPVFYLTARIDDADDTVQDSISGAENLFIWTDGTFALYDQYAVTDLRPLVPAGETVELDPPLWCQWYFDGGEPEGGFADTRQYVNEQLVFTLDCLSEIGKTFHMIKEENPDIDYQNIAIPDASGQCLGQAQDQFLYYFFGAQDSLSLSDLSAAYGDQLRCAGIVSTIGEVYPETIEGTPLEQFFSDHNILEYRYMEDGQINWGWIEFSCDGYLVWINTNESGAYSDGYVPAATIKRSYTVVIIDEEISDDNHSIADKYRNDYLGSSLTAVEAYRAVLQGNMEFRDTRSGENWVQETITLDTGFTIKPTYFSVVDLDADGTVEVILSDVNEDGPGSDLVLRDQDDIVYGYLFAAREFNDVKVDGTFWHTGGASDVGICRVTFDRDTYSIDPFIYSRYSPSIPGNGMSYLIDDQEVTEEEWDLAVSRWNKSLYVKWHEFTSDNIKRFL